MARGWESKNIEEQMATAQATAEARDTNKRTPEEMAKARERQGLMLAKAKLENDLKSVVHANHRAMLEKALQEIQDKLKN
jgi:DNA invertase Pin-like site-specific DNA recombinase